VETGAGVSSARTLRSSIDGWISIRKSPTGIDADVKQDFGTIAGSQGHRVLRGRHDDQGAIAGSVQKRAGRVDRHSIAHHSTREYRIRHLLQGRTPAAERGRQDELD
jgi:hypothetical protein